MEDDLRTLLAERTRYDPAVGRARRARALDRGARVRGERRRPGRAVRDRGAAAQRDRRAAHGPRAQRVDPGRADPRCTACRAATRSGSTAPITRASRRRSWSSACSRARALTRQELGREEFVERVWQWRARRARRSSASTCGSALARLPARALHDGRRRTRARCRGVRRAVPQGLPLPRQPHDQLVARSA